MSSELMTDSSCADATFDPRRSTVRLPPGMPALTRAARLVKLPRSPGEPTYPTTPLFTAGVVVVSWL